MLVETADGKQPIACYVNFAMHLDTVGGLYYSADYPYTLAKALAAVKGDGLVTVFTIGCCGDINHINVEQSDAAEGPRRGRPHRHPAGRRGAADLRGAGARRRRADPRVVARRSSCRSPR